MATAPISIFWFRRDLRLEDNCGLYHALQADAKVLGLFIFDTCILDKLEDRDDARVTFLIREVQRLRQEIRVQGGELLVRHGDPREVWPRLLQEYSIDALYYNHDYEPYALQRDEAIRQLLEAKGASVHSFKDHVLFEKGEVLKQDGTPYTVFTPYSRAWHTKLVSSGKKGGTYETLKRWPSETLTSSWHKHKQTAFPSLTEMGFELSPIPIPAKSVPVRRIREYADKRDFPGMEGTSRLGVHLRFGTISIREKARKALDLSPTFLNELIWRDFYAMILAHFPRVVTASFRPAYDTIAWRNDEGEYEAWCEGRTGYPLVDAGMRELMITGFMHNRVRMVTASFLTKHLLIDWRWGEAWFARKLLDFDLASNNGGWQWAAGCGTDAAPYFRIFNPESQQKKFDPDYSYIKRWVPEWGTDAYPSPIVDHAVARERCLRVFKTALNR
jgi:deoxyribodipyrimidine photo-lyase